MKTKLNYALVGVFVLTLSVALIAGMQIERSAATAYDLIPE